MSVTFATSCWEQDWNILLKTRFLQNKIQRNQYDFAETVLAINNVNDRPKVEGYAKKAVADGVISSYFFVEDCIDEALKYFELTREALDKAYYYSTHELASIYQCKTDYLLFYTGDSYLNHPVNWVATAVAELEKNPAYKVANLVWNQKFSEAKQESTSELQDFYVGFGFSDQCFLVRTGDFKAPIYNEHHALSERYPEYGGETFEKRVDSWMRNHGYLRLTYKHDSYLHVDFPKSALKRRLAKASGKYDQ